MLQISHAISNTNLKSALVPFITAGYPNLDITSKVLNLLDTQGVNAIELGIPYSDALADGVIIQESSSVALSQKTYVDDIFMLVKKESMNIKAPIIIFTYLNPILSKGIDLFIKELSESGAKGLVIPDLPLEESDYFIDICKYYDIELILFISPASKEKRIKETLLKAPGCIYLVSSYGVTGLRDNIDSNISKIIKTIKRNSDKPIMLGFGISNEKNVKDIIDLQLNIDAIVVGSAFINQITYSYKKNDYSNINEFCKKIKNAMLIDH